MTANTPFNPPFMVGFDALEEILSRISKNAEGFPPYNVEQLENKDVRITLAVAGYSENDLSVTFEESQLTIRGRQESADERRYLYKGIAGRSFVKSFVLADGMTVLGAQLENGLLHVDLKRPQRRPQAQTINIRAHSNKVSPVQTKGKTHAKK